MNAWQVDLTDRSQEARRLLRELAGTALETIAQRAEGYAKARCPVRTGRLQGSITHVVEDTTAVIGTPVEYAPYVELGTLRARAQPFLSPAVYEHVEEYRGLVQSSMKND